MVQFIFNMNELAIIENAVNNHRQNISSVWFEGMAEYIVLLYLSVWQDPHQNCV